MIQHTNNTHTRYQGPAMHGFGKLVFSNGDVYEGQFKGSMAHGYGKYTHADGSVSDEAMTATIYSH